jgi:hypothetical protein
VHTCLDGSNSQVADDSVLWLRAAEGAVPAASLGVGGIDDARWCQLQVGGRRLLQRAEPPPPAPVSGSPLGSRVASPPPPPSP